MAPQVHKVLLRKLKENVGGQPIS